MKRLIKNPPLRATTVGRLKAKIPENSNWKSTWESKDGLKYTQFQERQLDKKTLSPENILQYLYLNVGKIPEFDDVQ